MDFNRFYTCVLWQSHIPARLRSFCASVTVTVRGPCRMMAPVVEELAAEHPEYKFGKINVDEQPELAGEYRIMSIPTLMVFRGGQATAVKVGVTPKEELLKLLG